MAQSGHDKRAGRLAAATVAASAALDAHWAEIDAARKMIGVAASERPKGAITIDEYCKRYRVAAATGQYHIERMVRAGKLRRVRFRGVTRGGKSAVLIGFVPV